MADVSLAEQDPAAPAAPGLVRWQHRAVADAGAEEAPREVEELDASHHSSVRLPTSLAGFAALPWHRFNIVSTTVLVVSPFLAAYALLAVQLQWRTALMSVVLSTACGLSITAGYHRLYSHKAYDAALPVRLFFLLFGAASMQGSLKWWAHNHRLHHRFTDTERDPYNARRGFFYAHFGWMLFTPDFSATRNIIDLRDLTDRPLVRAQHRLYPVIGVLFGWVLPTLVAGLGWGDYMGGFFFGAMVRMVSVHHATFFVNSLAHHLGDQPFSDEHTPRDSFITALVTFGEGYHNFHHAFAQDYRNAILWWQWDPTKWLISILHSVGLAYDLRTFDEQTIRKGQVTQLEKKAQQLRHGLDWGRPIEELPAINMFDVRRRVGQGEQLIVIDGCVYDAAGWIDRHPGGRVIRHFIGKDASRQFNGAVYQHTQGARHVLDTIRVARLVDDAPAEAVGVEEERV